MILLKRKLRMKQLSLHNVEHFLEQMGDVEIKEDVSHRYSLRRRVLCSRFFSSNTVLHRRLYLLTMPIMTSGFIFIVLFVAATAVPLSDSSVVNDAPAIVSEAPAIVAGVADAATDVATDVVPSLATNQLFAQFIDDRPVVPVQQFGNIVPFQLSQTQLVQ